MKKKYKHCCGIMTSSISDSEVPLSYNPVFREYSLELRSPANKRVDYCPWCKTKLPASLRNIFFDVLEKEYQINDGVLEIFDNKQLPEEFKSGLWWKKRGL
jgi:hypothetical protein